MASEIKVDTISEKTAANGVSIDGVLIKDNEMGSTYLSDGLVLLTSATASSSANISLTDFVDSSTYNHYFIVGQNIVPASDGADFRTKFLDESDNPITGTYVGGQFYYELNNTGVSNPTANQSSTDLFRTAIGDIGTESNESLNFTARLFDNSSVSTIYYHQDSMGRMSDGDMHRDSVTAALSTTTVVDGIRFELSSGNIASGKFFVYGVK